MENHESREDYLERILMLSENGHKAVHAVDVALSMGFSKPSVSIAVKKHVEEKFVSVGSSSELYLTPSGLEIASKIYERHLILGEVLKGFGVSPEIAYRDACKIEHDLSDESWQALKAHYLEHKNDRIK